MTVQGNQLCAKHDKVFDENHPCPGCETEKAAAKEGDGEKKSETSATQAAAGEEKTGEEKVEHSEKKRRY